MKRALISFIFFLILLTAAFYASPYFINFLNSRYTENLPQLNLASSTFGFFFGRNTLNKIIILPEVREIKKPVIKATKNVIPKSEPVQVKEVSSKSLTELINSSVVQLYCGNMNSDKTQFSDISRGTGIIINSKGIVITNRHIIYDETFNNVKSDCFILRSPFPNTKSEKPKIYYFATIENWPKTEKFSKNFSDAKYYNDIALLKIGARTTSENSKINIMLSFDYALPEDYSALESNSNFNYLPIDWFYKPNTGDNIISAGYGTDASHLAYQITASSGRVAGALSTVSENRLDLIVIEGNATAGFSGGALINPNSKGLVGLVSWVSAGEAEGKFTVAIFRDFLSVLIKEEFGIDFKQLTAE